MGLKVLIFPLSIIIGIAVTVLYIWPGVMGILEKRALLEEKSLALTNVESVSNNVQSLTRHLERNKDRAVLVNRYYPQRIDQERVVDMLNFLAQQSGVVVNGLDLEVNQTKGFLNGVTGSVDPSLSESGGTAEQVVQPQSYTATVSVLGEYEGIRSFFERLYRTDRIRKLISFEVHIPKDLSQTDENKIPPTFLEGVVVAEYPYQPQRRVSNALHSPMFQQSAIDFVQAERLAEFINSPVSELANPATGRQNPFIPLP